MKPDFWFLDLVMWWKKAQRMADRRFLIPALEAQCKDDFQLCAAFALHMAYDRAWQVEDWQFDQWEISFLDRLDRA